MPSNQDLITAYPSSGTLSMRSTTSSKGNAAEAVKQILAVMTPPNGGDQKAFAAAMVALFSHYPPRVVAMAADPVTGIPVRVRFLSLIDAKSVLDAIAADERVREFMAAREAQPRPVPTLAVVEPDDPDRAARIAEKLRALSENLKVGMENQTKR